MIKHKTIKIMAGFGLLMLLINLMACSAAPTPKPNSGNTDNGLTRPIVPGVVEQPTPTDTALPEGEVTKVDWFEMRADTATSWKLQPDANDKNKFTLTLRNKGGFEGEEKRILALFFKKSVAFDLGLSVLANGFYQKKMPVNFTVINFEAKPDLGKQALEYATAEKFDLIYPLGSEASQFVHENYQNQPVPVVTVLSKDPVLQKWLKDYDTPSGTNIAYTSVNVPIELQVTYLKELKPQIKNIAVIYEKSNKSAIDTQVEPLRKAVQPLGVNVLDVVVEDNKKAKAELEVKVPDAVEQMRQLDPSLANSVFWVTGSTSVLPEVATLNKGAGSVAVLSVFPELVKEGDDSAVMSFGVSFEAATKVAVVYGADILQGKAKPGLLKLGSVTPPDIAINFKKANQIGLKIPFSFFESASFVYDGEGKAVRLAGQLVTSGSK